MWRYWRKDLLLLLLLRCHLLQTPGVGQWSYGEGECTGSRRKKYSCLVHLISIKQRRQVIIINIIKQEITLGNKERYHTSTAWIERLRLVVSFLLLVSSFSLFFSL